MFPGDTICNPEQPDNVPIDANLGHVIYALRRPFCYSWIAKDGSDHCIFIEKGFENDGASVPRIVWNIIPPDGRHRAAAIVHDDLYGRKTLHYMWKGGRWVICSTPWTRKEADKLFLAIMKEYKVPWLKRHVAYRAVRMGGWLAWDT